MATEPLILQICAPAIETSTGDRVYPVPIRHMEDFIRKYPALKPLNLDHKGYHCEQCHGEMSVKNGSKKQIHFFHLKSSECSSKDEDIKDDHGNWINESFTHRTAKQLLCVMLSEKREIYIRGAKCSTNGCLNCLSDYTLDYREGDVVHEEYSIDGGAGRSDAAIVNDGQIRHIFEIYYKHRSKDRPNHSWFELNADSIISQFELPPMIISEGEFPQPIIFQDIKPYDCANHRFADRPVDFNLPRPICDRSVDINLPQPICNRSAPVRPEQFVYRDSNLIAPTKSTIREEQSFRPNSRTTVQIFQPEPRPYQEDLDLIAKTKATVTTILKNMSEFEPQEQQQRQDEEHRRLEAERVARNRRQLKQAQELAEHEILQKEK